MNYGSPFYLLMILLMMAAVAGLFLLLRKRSERIKKAVVLSLMLLNLFQHLFKWAIYPMYRGIGFNVLSTAYNMCATLIILSPIAFLTASNFLKNFVYPVGCAAGFVAVAVPYWYIGMSVSELGWEYARFYICHALLFISSLLPLLLGLHKPSFKAVLQPGAAFLLALVIILINDIVFITLGLFQGYGHEDLYGSLLKINPCFSMGPPEEFIWLRDLSAVFTPAVFLGQSSTGLYTPILWYAIPLYIGITLVAIALFFSMDAKNLRAYAANLKARLKALSSKIKNKIKR